MSISDRYRAYAEAFEESYDDNDFSRLEQYFTEDAAYRWGSGPDDEPVLFGDLCEGDKVVGGEARRLQHHLGVSRVFVNRSRDGLSDSGCEAAILAPRETV